VISQKKNDETVIKKMQEMREMNQGQLEWDKSPVFEII
jgi:hypothetical protein